MKPTEPTDLPLSAAEESELDASEQAAWLEALAAAYRPGELDPERHLALIERALDPALAPPSAEELEAAEALQRALASDFEHADASVLRALKAAYEPSALSAENRAQLAPAAQRTRTTASNVRYVAFGVGSLAMAAALLLWLQSTPEGGVASNAATRAPSTDGSTLSVSRSTAALFGEPFATRDTSARIDRIAEVRQSELRNNRYLAWGVR